MPRRNPPGRCRAQHGVVVEAPEFRPQRLLPEVRVDRDGYEEREGKEEQEGFDDLREGDVRHDQTVESDGHHEDRQLRSENSGGHGQ